MANALLLGANQRNLTSGFRVVGRIEKTNIFGKKRMAAYVDGGSVGHERRVLARLKRDRFFGPGENSIVIPPELPKEGVILSADVNPDSFEPGAPRIVVASFEFDKRAVDFRLRWATTKLYGRGSGPLSFTAVEVEDRTPIEAIKSSGGGRFEITQTTLFVGQKFTPQSLASGLEKQKSKALDAVFPRFKSRTITAFFTP